MNSIQNSSMNRLLAAAGLVLTSIWMSAAEPGASATQEDQVEPGSEAIRAGERIKSTRLSLRTTSENPSDILKTALIAQEIEFGWDEDKQRYVAVAEVKIPIAPPVTPAKVIRVLNNANLILYPKAASQFASWLGMSNSFQANLSVGGSPVSRMFQDVQGKFQLQMDGLEKKLSEAQSKIKKYHSLTEKQGLDASRRREKMEKNIADQQKIVQELNKKAQFGPSTLDRLAIASDALIKKIDTNYTASSFRKEAAGNVDLVKNKLGDLSQEKNRQDADEFTEAQIAYEVAQNEVAALNAQIQEKKNEAEQYFKNYTETRFSQKYNYSADYDIVGLTPIKYAYGLLSKDGGGVYLCASAAFAWSPALERDTRAILHETGNDTTLAAYNERFRPSDLKIKNGEKTVTQWVNAQRDSIDTFGMGKWYVDKNGRRYWLGCAYAIEGGGASFDVSTIGVRKDAERNLGLCLNFKLQTEGTKTDSLIYNDNDSDVESKLQEVTKISRTGVDVISEALTGTFRMPLADGSESEPIRFYVGKTSAEDVRSAHKAVLQQAENAARAHQAKYEREGVRQAANEAVRRSEQDRSPIATGRADAAKNLQTKNKDNTQRPVPAAGGSLKAGNLTYRPATNTVNKSGTVDPFIRVDSSKVPDDF